MRRRAAPRTARMRRDPELDKQLTQAVSEGAKLRKEILGRIARAERPRRRRR